MIALDTNLLVYAHRQDSPFHAAALDTLERLANDARPWTIPWPCIHEFLSIVTHPRIYNPPSPNAVRELSIRIDDFVRNFPDFVGIFRESGPTPHRLADFSRTGALSSRREDGFGNKGKYTPNEFVRFGGINDPPANAEHNPERAHHDEGFSETNTCHFTP